MESFDEMENPRQIIYDYLHRNDTESTNDIVMQNDIDILIERLRMSIEIVKKDNIRSLLAPPFLNELYYLQLTEWAKKIFEDEINYIESVDPDTGEERYRLQQSFKYRQTQFNTLNELTTEFQSLIPNLEIKLARVKKYYDNFDSDDTTNPTIFDIKFIHDLHREFDGYLWNTMDIESFKNCFRITPKKLIKKDGVTVSAICYFFGLIEHKQKSVSSFADWITSYHANGNYCKLKNQYKEMAENASSKRNNFSLTTTQKKAIEIKQNIDDKLNRITEL